MLISNLTRKTGWLVIPGTWAVLLLILGCGPAATAETPNPPEPPGAVEQSVVNQEIEPAAGTEHSSAPVSEVVAAKAEPTYASATPLPSASVDALPACGTAAKPGGAPAAVLDREGQEGPLAERFRRQGWETDFSRSSVPLEEITSGGVSRDGIPPLDDPRYVEVEEADEWLEDPEPVILLEIDGDARAFPLQIMTWHEIVNDEVGGTPVSVTFCPLCNSAITFDRRLDGVVYDFGTSGNLRNSDLVMWDRQTESWWQQFTGEAIVGELTGSLLTFLPSTIVSWADFKGFHPAGMVLSRDTGYSRDYGQNPYVGYDRADEPPFLFFGEADGRLLPKERVAAVSAGGADVAFPFTVLAEEGAVNCRVGGDELVVFFQPGTRSALDHSLIERSKEVGATGIFLAEVDGKALKFYREDGRFIDEETGSVWDFAGTAVEGELKGAMLTPVVHANHFWFAWAAFKPETLVYRGKGLE